MALYPAPCPSHAEPTLQPSYFTSSLYVESLRTDINDLVLLYEEQYKANNAEPPFSVFKSVWRSEGWHLLHLRVFDDRTRERFLTTTFRLFLEKSKKSEPPFTRVTAVLALYTLYSTQPLGTTPALWYLKHITIPADQHNDLQELDAIPSGTELSALRPTISFILRYFRENGVFLILPDSNSLPENPRSLPREVHVDRGLIASLDPSSTKKKGRPTRNDKTRKAKSAVDSLESWLDKPQPLTEDSPALTKSKADEYQLLKSQLLVAIDGQNPDSEGHSAIVKANRLVFRRLQEVQTYVPQASDSLSRQERESAGVGRVESAMEDLAQGLNPGILGLLEGSGNSSQDIGSVSFTERFSLSPDPTTWGSILSPNHPEPDDYLHNPDPKRDRKYDSGGHMFTYRGLTNLGCMITLCTGMLTLFAGYPIFSHFTARKPSDMGGFNIGGINSTGQIPSFLGNYGLVDRETPADAFYKTSYTNPSQQLQLVFSDEFNTDGRTFYPGDDPYWEAVDLHYWATNNMEWYDPQAVVTRDGFLEVSLSRKDAHGLQYQGGMVSTWNKFCFTGGLLEVSVTLPGANNVMGLWPADELVMGRV
ncbi:hypothetical protein H1R20_g9884, partial [Candolleomyces eurysporus]